VQRINIGCGATPTPGWDNLDNSWTLRLEKYPLALRCFCAMGLAGKDQLEFANAINKGRDKIIYANAARRIPLPDNSASVIYTSHMVEHLDALEVRCFLAEAYRVLASGGILRIAVPDLMRHARRYVEKNKDADEFVKNTWLAAEKHRGVKGILRYLIVGHRHHHWMYDGASLIRLVESAGFRDSVEVSAGSTTIPDPGQLDLRQREEESVYVESRRP
jgi:predicted SAM-dependent methyltransferase